MAKSGAVLMSRSPPCDDSTTDGAPVTDCLVPFAMFTSQMRPGFSVTSARFDPGRKAIAHGELKVATVLVTNAGPPDGGLPGCGFEGCALLPLDPPPHAASISSTPICIPRPIITSCSYSVAQTQPPSFRLVSWW